ncbi:MAG: hypothetical protein ABI051_17640 [Vicinamibacterales bacterium]
MSIDTEYAVRRGIRNNTVLREVDSRHRGELLRYLLLVSGTVLLLLFSAWQRAEVLEHTRNIEQLRKEQNQETVNRRKLNLNLQMLQTPQHIEQRAMQMGLQRPSIATTVVIERAPESTPADGGVVAQVR